MAVRDMIIVSTKNSKMLNRPFIGDYTPNIHMKRHISVGTAVKTIITIPNASHSKEYLIVSIFFFRKQKIMVKYTSSANIMEICKVNDMCYSFTEDGEELSRSIL